MTAPDLRVVDGEELRTPPHDIDAEQSVLGAVLLSEQARDEVLALGLTAADFYRPAHQVLFGVVVELARAGQAVDAVTVADALARAGELERCGGASYLHTLIARTPAVASATYYARIVRGHRKLRRLIEVGAMLTRRGYSGDHEAADDLLAAAQADLLAAELEADAGEASAVEVIDEVTEWVEGDPASQGVVPTPYADLTELLAGGLTPGQLVVVGARPAVGKSTLALDFARHAALRCGLPVYLASLEMSRRELGMRLVAAEARIPLEALRGRRLTDEQWDRYAHARARVAQGAHLELAYDPGASVDEIRAKVQRLTRRIKTRVGLVIIDYLQLLRPRGRGENRQIEVAEMTRQAKLMAQRLEAPVILLSQLNRAPEQRTDKRPTPADLRESGAIEQDSDVVVLLHREDMYDPDTPRAGEADLIVAKHRNGPTATVTVAFQGHYCRFVDMHRP